MPGAIVSIGQQTSATLWKRKKVSFPNNLRRCQPYRGTAHRAIMQGSHCGGHNRMQADVDIIICIIYVRAVYTMPLGFFSTAVGYVWPILWIVVGVSFFSFHHDSRKRHFCIFNLVAVLTCERRSLVASCRLYFILQTCSRPVPQLLVPVQCSETDCQHHHNNKIN